MKEEKQADVSIESLISRLYELKKDHMMPYNLGDMGEMGKIIDKLKAGYAAANQPASLEFTEWVYGNCSKVESGVHTGLWFIKFKKGDDEDAEDVYYTLPQLHKIFNPLAAANQPQKVVCKFSPFEHNKSIFNLGQCHSCFSKTVIEYPANQPQPHESIEELAKAYADINVGDPDIINIPKHDEEHEVCMKDFTAGFKAAAAKDGKAEGSFLKVLQQNYQAQIAGFYNVDKTDAEREKRNAVIEEYKDLIVIFKDGQAERGNDY